tara:strand:+ start:145 stop:375 length:231 start_codon:yes stop_codon:yes gene_type:complete
MKVEPYQPSKRSCDRLRKAVKDKDAKACFHIAESLSITFGMRYHEICDLVKRETGIEVSEWDSYVYEGESNGSEDD